MWEIFVTTKPSVSAASSEITVPAEFVKWVTVPSSTTASVSATKEIELATVKVMVPTSKANEPAFVSSSRVVNVKISFAVLSAAILFVALAVYV